MDIKSLYTWERFEFNIMAVRAGFLDTHTHTLILVLGFGLCNVKFSTKSLLSSNHRVKSGLAEVEVGV